MGGMNYRPHVMMPRKVNKVEEANLTTMDFKSCEVSNATKLKLVPLKLNMFPGSVNHLVFVMTKSGQGVIQDPCIHACMILMP